MAHRLAWESPLVSAVRGWSPARELALATARVLARMSVQAQGRVQVFEPVQVQVQVQVFEQALESVPVSVFEPVPESVPVPVFEPVRVPVPVSGLAQVLASELAREPASGPVLALVVVLALREWLWEDCPLVSLCLCPSRWQRCKSARARRQ